MMETDIVTRATLPENLAVGFGDPAFRCPKASGA